jgi:ATP-dependent 26S proteasome regulatory subunit
MKNTLKCQVIEFFGKRAKFEALGLPFKRGVFLYGPPGNGKTMVGKVLASQAPANFIWVTPRNIDRLSPVKGLAAVFELARLIAPTIVFVEDVDLMGGGNREVEFKALLGELLNQLDGVVANNGIITIATTNNIEMMDKALASRPGRFDLKLEFPNPDRIGRETLLRRALAKADVDGESMMEGVEATEGCSGAQTCEVAYRAMLLAVERGGEEDRTIAVTGSLLEESARLVRGKRKVVGFVQSANGNGNAPSRSLQEVSPT